MSATLVKPSPTSPPMAHAAIGTIATSPPPQQKTPANTVQPLRLTRAVQCHIERMLTILSECDLASEETLTLAHDAHTAMMALLGSMRVSAQQEA